MLLIRGRSALPPPHLSPRLLLLYSRHNKGRPTYALLCAKTSRPTDFTFAVTLLRFLLCFSGSLIPSSIHQRAWRVGKKARGQTLALPLALTLLWPAKGKAPKIKLADPRPCCPIETAPIDSDRHKIERTTWARHGSFSLAIDFVCRKGDASVSDAS